MPMYEYVCKTCDHQFEVLAQPGEGVTCPECTSERLEKLLSVPGAPQVSAAAGMPMTCRSEGPPCGPACSRWPA